VSAFCQRDWTQLDEENLAIGTLSKVLHPQLSDEWKVQASDYSFVCRGCRCQIEAGSRYYWHNTAWLAYHPTCVQAQVDRRAKR
jgi:hypothetical protein